MARQPATAPSRAGQTALEARRRPSRRYAVDVAGQRATAPLAVPVGRAARRGRGTCSWNSSAARAPARSAASRSTRGADGAAASASERRRRAAASAQARRTPRRRGRRGARRPRAAGRRCGPGRRRRPGRARPRAAAAPSCRTRDAGEARVVVVRVGPPARCPRPGRPPRSAARVRSSSGRRNASNARRMPASERPPVPRVSPSSTVSAWSSRVWPSSTVAAPKRSASSSRTAYRASRAAASRPLAVGLDVDPDRRRSRRRRARPSAPTTRSACSAEPSCRPWSTVTPTTRQGRLARLEDGGGQQRERVGAAGAGDQDGRGAGVAGVGRAPRRTASRTAATAGSGPVAAQQDAGHPGGGVGDLGLGRQVVGVAPRRR